MTSEQQVELLRFALAAIWTEMERVRDYDNHTGNAQTIAEEALEATKDAAKAKVPNDTIGYESWVEFKSKLLS